MTSFQQQLRCFLIAVLLTVISIPVWTQEYRTVKLQLFPDKEQVIVRYVCRDSKDFIWFLSDGRIYRYNGYSSLDILDSLSENNGLDDTPQQIFMDNRDRLWIAGISSISYLDLKSWQLFTLPEEKMPPWQARNVLWMQQTPRGMIVIGYENGHLLFFNDTEVVLNDVIYQKGRSLGKTIGVRSYAFWKEKAWVGTTDGQLFSVDFKDKIRLDQHDLMLGSYSVEFILVQEDGLILDIANSGVYSFGLHSLNNIKDAPIAFDKRHILKNSKDFFVYERLGEIAILERTTLQQKSFIDNITTNTILDVFDIAISGSEIILATSEGVWIVYPKTEGISSLLPQNNKNKQSVRGLYKFDDGSIFYASYGNSEFIDYQGNFIKIPEVGEVYSILPMDKSRLLLGIEGGFLKIFDKQTLSFQEMPYKTNLFSRQNRDNTLPKYVKSLAEDDENYYLGTTLGLWVLHKKTLELFPFDTKDTAVLSPNLHIYDITVIADKIYLSTHLGFLEYSEGHWKKQYPKGSRIMGVYQHLLERDTIWLATQNEGIVAIDLEGNRVKTLNSKNGLSNNLVYSLTAANGYLVAGTSNGLNLIKGNKIKILNTKDGIQQNEFNHGAAFYDTEKKLLYAGGLKGYTVLDMDKQWLEEEVISKTISEIRIANTKNATEGYTYTYPYNPKEQIILSSNEDLVNIHVGVPKSYKGRDRIKYKLSNKSSLWDDIQQGQPISLMGFSPEEYNLVIGREDTTANINLRIIKKPAFFQTWWFRLVILLLLLITIWVWLENRKQKMRKEQRLRTQISSDLHDEVGSLLTGISMQAEFLQISKKELPKETYLKSIADSCKSAILAMGDIVWSIDARNDNWKSLIIKLREYAYHMFEAKGINFMFEEEGGHPQGVLTQQQRHSIYLVVKEALNNSCKHAEATEVGVVFRFGRQEVLIQITDNGKGFDLTTESSGQGLQNMKNRIEKINGKFKIETNSEGTQITIVKNYSKNYLVK